MSGWSGFAYASGLVIAGWVKDQFADELAGGGVVRPLGDNFTIVMNRMTISSLS
jgi:hypothetical protein